MGYRMDWFIEQRRQHALMTAAFIKGEIYGDAYYLKFNDVFYMDPFLLNIAFRPKRFTLLHHYISYRLLEEYERNLRKTAPDIYEEIYQEFESYQTEYQKFESYKGVNYNQYLLDIYKSNIHSPLVTDTFTILFESRDIMKKFNLHIADEIKKFTVSNYPFFLKFDGVMKRCTYWPEWLKQGLLRREQGHCAICQKNVTGGFVNKMGFAIDHIVPLNLGGVNDPTNLQMLCGDCNNSKGGEKTTTSDKYAPFWLPE